MKALIQEGLVCQLEEEAFPVSPSLIWVECGAEVETGWVYDYDNPGFSPPPPMTLDEVRGHRNFTILESDWTQLPDSALSAEKKAEWAVYRQTLRDLPASYPDVTWPTVPE
ncbi:MAG: hypothetical protein CMO16_02900 [Thaumarchaeota archaeon]|nr:hypothetical protein [Nitrososphaerota archaeon]|tara:strand:- start:934 stop:1266 length:333 start_codon:yes stop_codon:yes gene_type:complete